MKNLITTLTLFILSFNSVSSQVYIGKTLNQLLTESELIFTNVQTDIWQAETPEAFIFVKFDLGKVLYEEYRFKTESARQEMEDILSDNFELYDTNIYRCIANSVFCHKHTYTYLFTYRRPPFNGR